MNSWELSDADIAKDRAHLNAIDSTRAEVTSNLDRQEALNITNKIANIVDKFMADKGIIDPQDIKIIDLYYDQFEDQNKVFIDMYSHNMTGVFIKNLINNTLYSTDLETVVFNKLDTYFDIGEKNQHIYIMVRYDRKE